MPPADAQPGRRPLDGAAPTVADSAFVSERSYLIGDVTVGERASVWPFACARADSNPVRIGAASNLQEFAMLHGSSLGGRVTVGHGAVVDNATVGDDVLVGMQSAVMGGATVESGALVAAGAVVLTGQTVPSGHVAYGTPAETQPLGEGQREEIEKSAAHYVDFAARYKAEGGFE